MGSNGTVSIKRSLVRRKPTLSEPAGSLIAATTTIRNSKKRSNGRVDFSDVSKLMQNIDSVGLPDDRYMMTEALVVDIKTYLERGLGLEETCDLVGISYETLKLWRRKYPLFEKFVRQCLAQSEQDALENIKIASKGGAWQASGWLLERKFPRKWGKRDFIKQEIFHQYQSFVKIVVEVINECSPELKERIVTRLRDKDITI